MERESNTSQHDNHNHKLEPEAPQHHNHNHKQHPIQYLLPSKIILHVDHPTGLGQTQLAELIASALGQLGKGQIKTPEPGTILTFPLQNGQGLVFSLVPAEVTSANQQELVALLQDLYSQLKDKPINISTQVSIRAVSPDWLVGNATHGIGTVGPGAWPVEAPRPEGDRWKFRLQDQQGIKALPFANGQGGAGVHVAILDTAPSVIDLNETYDVWHDRHPLVKTLLGPAGKLHVHSGTYADLDLIDYTVTGHRYLMPDHGLFIAGIIHSIAPEATLHLFKVFSPYGVSSIETIAQGLLQVLQNPDVKRPLIINCSFGLCIPLQGHSDPDFPVALRDPVALQHMSTSLREILDRLTQQKEVIVVAAAGNDATHNNSNTDGSRPFARYPASFDSVLGVGALPKQLSGGQYMAASYSNLSDAPPKVGYMTLGGEPGPKQGVLGLYISEFPVYDEPDGCLSFLWRILTLGAARRPGHLPQDMRALTLDRIRYKRNRTGWAWWAGTSFATPIVGGILAAWRSQPGNRAGAFQFRDAQQALDGLSQSITTDEGEKVILVMQEAEEA